MSRRSATAPRPSDATRTARHGGPDRPPDSRVPSFSRQLGKRRWVSAPQAGGGIWRTGTWRAWLAGDLANGGLAGLAGGGSGERGPGGRRLAGGGFRRAGQTFY